MSTEYVKTNWQDGDIITADKMNNIENGIERLDADATSLKEDLTALRKEEWVPIHFKWEHGGIDNATGENNNEGSTVRSRDVTYYKRSDLFSITNKTSNIFIWAIFYTYSNGTYTFLNSQRIDPNVTHLFEYDSGDYVRFDVRGSLDQTAYIGGKWRYESFETIKEMIGQARNNLLQNGYSVAEMLSIQTSTGTLVVNSFTSTIIVEAKPNTRYIVWKPTKTGMRIGASPVNTMGNGDTFSVIAYDDTASSDPITITTTPTDNYLYIQLYLSGDQIELKSIVANVDYLMVYEDSTAYINKLKVDINAVIDGVVNIASASTFGRGTLSAGQMLIDGYAYRVSSLDIIKLSYTVQLVAEDGFRFKLCFFNNGTYDSETSWVTDYLIQKNTEFKITIARVTDDTTETANIAEYLAQINGHNADNVENISRSLFGKNLCGDDPKVYYPVELNEGDLLTLSTSTGTAPDYIELEFYDENYIKLNNYSFMASTRTIAINYTTASAKYIKWSATPSVPLQVEFGGAKTAYTKYEPNIYTFKEECKNTDEYAYITGPVPILSVMSYNVGEWYNGTRTAMPADQYELYENIQKEILLKNYASILCTQEYYYLMHEGALNSRNLFLTPLFKQAVTLDETMLTLGKALATNLRLKSCESVNFVNQSGVAQRYQKAYVYINGHKVCVCNVHLSQLDSQQRLLETQELVSAMSNEEYFIVAGDFNVNFNGVSGTEADSIIQAFTSIGAKTCNAGDFGVFNTYRGSAEVGTSDEANDNIFVSSNITIKSVYIDTTKIDAQLPIQDHVPLIANLEIL